MVIRMVTTSPILQCDSFLISMWRLSSRLESLLQPSPACADFLCFGIFWLPIHSSRLRASRVMSFRQQERSSKVPFAFPGRSVQRGKRMVWKGAKRRCRPKLERLVRVLFGSHPRGRGIQTVRSISPSGTGAEGQRMKGMDEERRMQQRAT